MMMTRVASCVLRVASEERSASTRNSQLATRNYFPGFTFIEVLFAVILLGIGFIMIAGVFPVAIQQTAAVSDETQGTAIARDAIKKIQAVADSVVNGTASSLTLFPATGTVAAPAVVAFSPNIMQALGSDSFFSADRRYGWVGFYRRDSITSPFAQVYVIALQNPNFLNYVTKYAPGETTQLTSPYIPPAVAPPIPPTLYNYYQSPSSAYTPTNPPAAGVGASIPAQFFYNPVDGTTTVVLAYSTSSTPAQTPNGVTGAFVLIGAPGGSGPAVPTSMIGRFCRLGNSAPLPSSITSVGTTIYQSFVVQPGYDITPADVAANSSWASATLASPVFTANVFLMGAAPTVDANGEFTGPFTGPNQDIGVASGFIRVNTANN
jgi:type II secretory pathway pseudopilin PulG